MSVLTAQESKITGQVSVSGIGSVAAFQSAQTRYVFSGGGQRGQFCTDLMQNY